MRHVACYPKCCIFVHGFGFIMPSTCSFIPQLPRRDPAWNWQRAKQTIVRNRRSASAPTTPCARRLLTPHARCACATVARQAESLMLRAPVFPPSVIKIVQIQSKRPRKRSNQAYLLSGSIPRVCDACAWRLFMRRSLALALWPADHTHAAAADGRTVTRW